MIDFRPIFLSDRQWAEPLLAMGNFRGSEYVFSNNFNYRKIYGIEIARMNDYYLVYSCKPPQTGSYLYPSGSGDVKPVIEAMMQDAQRRGHPFQMHAVPPEAAATMEMLFPGRFSVEETRNSFDYIYESQSLITLSGKKLHSKRNFINRFQAEHNGRWAYEPITPDNLDECWAMNMEWCREMGCDDDDELREEGCAIKSSFQNFTALGLSGGLLRLDGKIIAYTMGRPLNSDTFIVHIEKAFASIAGAYQMINQQFVTHNCADFKYINREEDTGDEGLRKAKLSYRPVFLQEKYILRLL